VVGLALALASRDQAGFPGVIFTADATGVFVNANVYDNAADVYLNGEPGVNTSCTAASLPDGVLLPGDRPLGSGSPVGPTPSNAG
jgi:hypothetical protein